jgi:autoinducer 2-degrading protein
MSMNIILVHFTVKPEHIERFLDAVETNARASLEEPGCLRFDVLQHPEGPHHIWLYEIYENEAAVTAHQESDHFKACVQAVEGLTSRPPITHRLVNHFPPDSELICG